MRLVSLDLDGDEWPGALVAGLDGIDRVLDLGAVTRGAVPAQSLADHVALAADMHWHTGTRVTVRVAGPREVKTTFLSMEEK